MSTNAKRKDETDTNASDDNADTPLPPKKIAKTEKTDNADTPLPPKKTAKTEKTDEDSIFICEISKNRRVSVRMWQGKVMVDIREFYLKDGKQMPGKKGISLTMDQWKVLREHAKEIDEAVAGNA